MNKLMKYIRFMLYKKIFDIKQLKRFSINKTI